MFLDPLPRVIKIKKSDLIKLKSFCTTKETKNKKTTYVMGENICQCCNWQGISIQNIKTAHITQQKNNQLKQKNELKTLKDISPKKTCRWPVGTWKDDQHP